MVTGRARSHIRQFFKSKQHNDAVQLGQRLLDNALIPFGEDTAHLPVKQLNKTLAKFQYASLEELFDLGQVHPLSIATSLLNNKSFILYLYS
ncbi:RelA/SpoT AH/RIS domain-containing protein [Rickettsiella massiliensis]|uniref:RelA/SpoT AH/RIS domain-containing protein n=1 Tax=Rickettsiella massiliensis TaxID=676517 RepID=UPI00029B0A9B|nr:RelA/SpoT AH/RIS domain-containing protein [Rickettsiella massiliensis]